jgi:hypothetical protein
MMVLISQNKLAKTMAAMITFNMFPLWLNPAPTAGQRPFEDTPLGLYPH